MITRKILVSTLIAGLSLTAFTTQAQADEAPKNQIKTEILTDGVYLLTGPGGNIGVSVGDDGVFVIDDKFARFSDQILAQISAITDKPLKYVINTHYHGDHTGANAEMKEVGATIVAHDNVRKRMGITFENRLWGRTVKAVSENKWPTVTFSDTTTFHFNGQPVNIIHTPSAHTDGDSIVYFEGSNILHMGDNYFNGMFPYVDVDSGGSLQGMIVALTQGLSLSDEETRIIPGHGDMSTKADMTATRDMLVDILARVKTASDAGKSQDDIIADKPLADLKAYAKFIDEDNMIRIAYRSLNPEE